MGKDTKEMLRRILANTQLIMKHLNIDGADKKETASAKKVSVKGLAKRAPVKKSTARKK